MTDADRARLADSLASVALTAAERVIDRRMPDLVRRDELATLGAVVIEQSLRLRSGSLELARGESEPAILGRAPSLSEQWSAAEPEEAAHLADQLVRRSAAAQDLEARVSEIGTRDEIARAAAAVFVSALRLEGASLVFSAEGAEPLTLGQVPTFADLWRGTHDAAAEYRRSELVIHRGSAWLATTDHPAGDPIPGPGWELFAQRGHTGSRGRCNCLGCGGGGAS